MSTVVLTDRLDLTSASNAALNAAARFWFVVAVTGQWIFAFYIALVYGSSAARGNWLAWNKSLANGYVPGNTLGNTALAAHLLFASMITLSGALQLTPQIRARVPAFHRWNGRMYMLLAFTMGISGLYLTLSGRRVVGDATQHVAVAINALLILACAALAWRYAVAGDFRTHRRWALRLFLVVGGVWFFRVGLMFWLVLNRGPVGFDPKTFEGPFITFLSFAVYLLPLTVLEVYLRTQERAGAPGRFAVAAGLLVLTLAMAVGIVAATIGMWRPRIRRALDTRQSITQALSTTIESRGIEPAAEQYRRLKAAGATVYNFDEGELNTLGYTLIRARRFKEAIRILQLNVEAYPRSSNAYDSLAEAYMEGGNRSEAITNYRKSVALDPTNRGAAQKLRQLLAPGFLFWLAF